MSVPFSFNWEVHQDRKRTKRRRSHGGVINLPEDWTFFPSDFQYYETITAVVNLNENDLPHSSFGNLGTPYLFIDKILKLK